MNAAAFPTELLGRLVDGFNHPAALAVLLVAFACSLTTFVIVVVASELARASATVRRLERSPASSLHAERAARIAGAIGVSPEILESLEISAFTHGILRPRISVTNGLIQAMSDQELEAVLRHERVHVRAMDPLRLAVVRAIGAVLFLVPFVSGLLRAYACRRELLADETTVEEMHTSRPLLAALHRAVDARTFVGPAVVIAGLTELDLRIDRLAGIPTPLLALIKWPSRRDVASFGLVTLFLAIVMLMSAHSVSACLVQVGAACGT